LATRGCAPLLYASRDRERGDRRHVNGESAVVNAEIGVNSESAMVNGDRAAA
jgi:hypothetical protein